MRKTALSARDLAVRYGPVHALRGVDLDLVTGRTVAVVGESGAGKSTLVRALGGLLVAPGVPAPSETAGTVEVGTRQVAPDRPAPEGLRAATVAVLPQQPSLDPLWAAVEHVREPFRAVGRRTPSRSELATRFAEVGLPAATMTMRPHQLSGGQARRVALAAALALDPEVLVLDEPTAGLDPVTAAELLDSVTGATGARATATLLVTHELSVAAGADEIVVLYAGRVVERGESGDVLRRPRHPYTVGLVGSSPTLTSGKDLHPLRGLPPSPENLPPGCAFHPRCPQAIETCVTVPVDLDGGSHQVACHRGGLVTRISARGLRISYSRRRSEPPAVDGIDLDVRAGEAVGIVGASGSGKSTLARMLSGHLRPDAGRVTVDGVVRAPHDRLLLRQVQLVQQDPWAALPPRWPVGRALAEPLELEPRRPNRDAIPSRIAEALAHVGLEATPRLLEADPRHLSGGQAQRVALARALLVEPAVLVADEPTSMLDPSERARLAMILRDQQIERGLALVLVSHDLALLRKTTDRLLVLDRGRLVEEQSTDRLLSTPRHDATRALVAAARGDSSPRADTPHEGETHHEQPHVS